MSIRLYFIRKQLLQAMMQVEDTVSSSLSVESLNDVEEEMRILRKKIQEAEEAAKLIDGIVNIFKEA